LTGAAFCAVPRLSKLVNRTKADADVRLREFVAELDAGQKQFDDETDHGQKTGVNLDWTSDFDDFPAR
jgi:hypothetical protein